MHPASVFKTLCNDVADTVDVLSNPPILISSADDDDDLPSLTADDVCNEVCTYMHAVHSKKS